MANVNQILPFGVGANARVLKPEAYLALAARVNGFVAGIADETQLNTVWRQSSVVAAMIAQFTVDQAKVDVLDDGNVALLETSFTKAVGIVATAQALALLNNLKIPGRTPWRRKAATQDTLFLPAGTSFSVDYLYGAGGGGGGGGGTAGGGGGGGARTTKAGVATLDTVLLCTIGGGGAPGLGGNNASTAGSVGGTSSIVVQSGSVLGTDGVVYGPGSSFCACTGGAGGPPGTSAAVPPVSATAAGGIASNGDQNDNGDVGGLPFGTPSTFWVSGSGGASPGNSASLFAQGATQVTSTSPGVGGAGGGGTAPGTKGSDGGLLIYR